MITNKFAIGDKVRVVKYGHLILSKSKEVSGLNIYRKYPDGSISYDTLPELVGEEGLVREISEMEGVFAYALAGIKGKTAWYNEDQLEFLYNTSLLKENKWDKIKSLEQEYDRLLDEMKDLVDKQRDISFRIQEALRKTK